MKVELAEQHAWDRRGITLRLASETDAEAVEIDRIAVVLRREAGKRIGIAEVCKDGNEDYVLMLRFTTK